MASRIWLFLINTFLVNTNNNFKKTLTLISDHLSKLESQISDAYILAIYNTFLPLKESFENLYSQWQLTLGTYEGKTQSFEERMKHFSVTQIDVWRGKVFNIFAEKTPTAKEIFYDARKPFQQGTYEQRINAFKTLGDKLATYTTEPSLVTLSVEVLLAYNELKTLRNAQQNKEGASAIFSAGLETARIVVCQEMYSNLGLLMSKYKQTPEVIGNYFDLSLIRKTIEDAVKFNGTIAANSIISLTEVAGTDLEATPETLVRLKNTSTNAVTLIFYAANSPTDPPGPGVQFTLLPGQTLDKTLAELGQETFSFFNIQNVSAFEGTWEVEVLS